MCSVTSVVPLFTRRVVHLHPAPFQTQHSNLIFFQSQAAAGLFDAVVGLLFYHIGDVMFDYLVVDLSDLMLVKADK